jgi:hypothetical protein
MDRARGCFSFFNEYRYRMSDSVLGSQRNPPVMALLDRVLAPHAPPGSRGEVLICTFLAVAGQGNSAVCPLYGQAAGSGISTVR